MKYFNKTLKQVAKGALAHPTKGAGPGAWQHPLVLIFFYCIKIKEIGHSGYERYHEINPPHNHANL